MTEPPISVVTTDGIPGLGDSDKEAPGLTGAVITGAKWKVIAQIVSEGSRVILALVLARMLTPADYGVAGLAVVAGSLVLVFTDPALGAALVQRPQITERDRSTMFWTSVSIGAVTTVVAVALSGVAADLLGNPDVQPLFAVVALSFVFNSIAVTPTALLARHLAFRSLEIRDITSTLVATSIALVVAFAGFGPWAIVANWLTYAVVSSVLVTLLAGWRPHLIFSTESLRDLGGFGLKVFGARTLSWANLNLDNLLVGRFLGAASLGAYALAYNVMFLPMARIGLPLQQVVSPAFARMQADRERLERAWLRSKGLSTALLIPGYVVTFVVAPDLISVVFGSKWNAAVIPLQLLCVAGLAHSLVALNFSILQACGAGNALLRLNLIVSAFTLTAFVAGLPFGIEGVAGFYAIAKWMLVLVDTRITTNAISFEFWPALRTGTRTLPAAAVAAGVGLAFRDFLVDGGVPSLVRLVVVALAVLGAYVLLLVVFYRSVTDEVRQLVRERRGSPAKPAAPASDATGS